MTADAVSARRDWEIGYRRLRDETHDPAVAEPLHQQLDAVTAELRKGVGVTFTLSELADFYVTSERWLQQAITERTAAVPVGHLATVVDAAFCLFCRSASDYTP